MNNRRGEHKGHVHWFWQHGINTLTSIILIAELYRIMKKSTMKSEAAPRPVPKYPWKNHEASHLQSYVLTETPQVTFNDIGGLENLKETLKMEVIYPKIKRELYSLYDRLPGCGVLLYGPPGCGKTLIAKALARETGSEITFMSPLISNIMSRWVGKSEKIVASIFEYAQRCGKVIIFLDELDALLPRSGPSYMRRIKDTFLQCLDGIYSKKEHLLIVGATNKPWLIDPAIRRPGRFGKIIMVPPPDLPARKQIFAIHLQRIMARGLIDPDVDLEELAIATRGYSGADIKAICDEARDIPLHEAINGGPRRGIGQTDFTTAISARKPSIRPWITEALRAIKRYHAEEFAQPVLQVAAAFR